MQAAKLDKKSRNALTDDDFAVPGKRKLPINDGRHTRLAWDMVERTQGLTPEEKAAARRRILQKAKEHGIDTGDWHKVKAMNLEAMALNISNNDDHPNKMPFSGVLVRLDEPSDAAPGGAHGRRIIVTAEAAERALPSLLGMAVDFTPSFDGHDTQAKIGIITSANIVGNEVAIEGFVYAADFPETASSIKALKSVLGFSFEAQRLTILDPSADILTITDLAFTGAAILRKDKAAYRTTSLAASATIEDLNMTPEELKAMLTEAVAPISQRLDKIEADAKKTSETIQANANVRAMVEPHAATLESCAASMEAAGVGADPKFGHAAALRRMAGSMRAEAAIGKVPHIWRDHDYPTYASADNRSTVTGPTQAEIDASITKAVEAATKPLLDKVAAAETKLKDVTEKARLEAAAPERKTVNPMVTALLAKASIGMPEGDAKLNVSQVDAALKTANLPVDKRLMVKNELTRAGVLQ